jgi:hypothetical protein
MYRERTDASHRPQPETDDLAIEHQRACCPCSVFWWLTGGGERAVRDTDGRKIEHCAKMESQPGPSRVVAPGRVYQQDVRGLGQTAYGPLKYGAHSKGEQAWLVGRASRPDRHVMPTAAAPPHERGRRPGRIAAAPAAAVSPSKADEASTDR